MKAQQLWFKLGDWWKQSRRWQRICVYFFSGYLVYVVLGLTLVPWLAKNQLESQLSQLLNRQVSISKVHFHPVKLAATVEQFEVASLHWPDDAPLLGFQRLHVDFGLSSLFNWSWDFEHLELDGLYLHLGRLADGALNIDDLFVSDEAESIEPAQTENTESTSIPRLSVGEFHLRDAFVKISDQIDQEQATLDLRDLHLELYEFITYRHGEDENGFTISAQLGDTGALNWQGEIDLPSSQLTGRIALESLGMSGLFEFLQPYTPLRLPSGQLDAQVDYLLDFSDSYFWQLEQGRLAVQQLQLNALGKTPLRLQALELSEIEVDSQRQLVQLKQNQIEGLQLSAELDEQLQLDWLKMFAFRFPSAAPSVETVALDEAGQPVTAQDSPQTSAPWEIQIAQLELSDSVIEFTENFQAEKTKHRLNLQLLRGGQFSSLQTLPVTLQLQSSLNQAPLSADLNFLPEQQRYQVAVDLRQLGLAQFDKWYEDYLQLELASGELAAQAVLNLGLAEELKFSVEQGRIALNQLAANQEQQEWLQLQQAEASGLALDLASQQLNITELAVNGLDLQLDVEPSGQVTQLELLLAPLLLEPAPIPEHQPEGSEPSTELSQTASVSQPEQSSTESEAVEQAAQQQAADSEVPDPGTKSTEAAWQVKVATVSAKDWQVAVNESFSGQVLQHLLAVEAASLAGLEYPALPSANWQVQALLNQHAQLNGEGQLDIADSKLAGAWQLSELALNHYQAHLAPYLNIELADGALSSQIRHQIAWQPFSLVLSGDSQLKQLRVLDGVQNSELLLWKQLQLQQWSLNTAEQSFALEKATVEQPFAKVVINENFTTNLSGLAVTSEQPQTTDSTVASEVASEAAPQQPWSVQIGEVEIIDGETDFADLSLNPNFAAKIEKFGGRIGRISSDAEQAAEIELRGEVDGYAPVSLTGSMAPLAALPMFDTALSFKHLELTRLSTYSGTYAGFVIERGQMSLNLDYQLEGEQLQGQNQILIEQLKLGQRTNSEKATSLPVELAIALLEDEQGVIDLDLAVSGNVDDPEFSVGALVAKAFGSAITKLITSPFAIIGALVGDDETINQIHFTPGLATLSEEQVQRMAKLAEGLQLRPQLKLGVTGFVLSAQDIPELKRIALAEQLIAAANSDKLATEVGLSEVLADRQLRSALIVQAQKQWGPQQLTEDSQRIAAELPEGTEKEQKNDEVHGYWYQQLRDLQEVDEAQLNALAEQRAIEVKDLLAEQYGIPVERMFVEKQGNIESPDIPKVELTVLQ